MNKHLLYAAFTLIGITIGVAITYQGEPVMDKEFAFKLKEPLLIATSSEKQNYLLPANTVLFHQQSFAEGHSLYAIEVLYKGKFSSEPLSKDTFAEPLWLYNMETEDVGTLLKNYPLSKEDLVRILKARQVTREDLEQIILEWAD